MTVFQKAASPASPMSPAGSSHPAGSDGRAGSGGERTARATLRPTPRTVFCFSLSVPAALLVVTCFPGFWYVSLYLPAAVLTCLAADLIMILPDGRLRAAARSPGRLAVGQSGLVLLDLAAGESDGDTAVVALLEQTGEADAPVAVAGTPRGGPLKLPLVPRRRGRLVINAVWLRWRGPLGLVELRRRQPVGDAVDVVPDVRGIREEALLFFARDAMHGMKSQRPRGGGTEFETLRDYAPGMDNRFIDWKRSARHRKLLCKEFRQERNHQIVFGFDTGHLMLEPVDGVPKLDRAIRSGLLLARVSLHNGDLVGGCAFDARFRGFLKPGRGMPSFTRFQRFTAALAYRTEETNFTLGLAELNGRLQRRALVVLFTEFVDVISAELLLESLRRMTRRHVIIFVTLRDPLPDRLRDAPPNRFADVARAVIAGDFLRERAIVLERMARMGVHCLDTPAGDVSSALLNRYLLIKQRGLL